MRILIFMQGFVFIWQAIAKLKWSQPSPIQVWALGYRVVYQLFFEVAY